MNSKRFEALTGLRAFAASLVFVYHNRKYWRAQIHPELLRLLNEFHIGVSLFFVLSGFLIAYNYGGGPAKSFRAYGKYIMGRMARILPLYWLILTAYYLDPSFGKFNFSALNYSLIHGFSNIYNLTAIAQAWSLNVEMTFYVLAPFLWLIQKKHRILLLVTSVLLFLSVWSIGEIWCFVNKNPKQFFYPLKFLLDSTFSGRAVEFIGGMFLAQSIKTNNLGVYSFIPQKTILGLIGIFLTIYIIGGLQNEIYHHGFEHPIGRLINMIILPFFIVLFIMGLITEKGLIQQFFSSKFIMLLGSASYAFYLIHISYVNIRVRTVWLGADRNFILLWCLSIILYLFFEKPIYDFIQSKIKYRDSTVKREINSSRA